MIRFKLAYELPNQPGHYIAPQLLPISQPDYLWDNTGNLILRYTYDFMPKGILTRLIVETHQSIEDQNNLWKNGVVLSDDWARAQIIENYPKKEINVRVSGSNKKPLLEIVRHELRKIHNSYERLEYQELIPCNCSKCKSSAEPDSYPYDLLIRYKSERKYTIECRNSFEQVDVRQLITDITNFPDSEDFITRPEFFRSQQPRQTRVEAQPSLPTADVFISYATVDGTQAAQRLHEEMEDSGFTVWQDVKSLRGGEDWKEQLREAIRRTKAVLVLLTPGSMKSEYVEWECEMARMAQKKIIPVLILDCEVPAELQRLQHRDLSQEARYMKGLLAIIKDLNAIK